ncbi:hypothetical protein AEAC466_16025 [Asticcacaulis sp. AC466]|uniref:DUF3617 domain-containing protein n=1 Tax=Asticcacaulis sp. AC466 TaxID=1282362 RepID=UPI0003C3CFC2|nr:DUF3617 family protein [Asticcacaulis sp. AC466]ESQ82647.1 hypothetical protein AEAC466_16025 [Asticcacaulis sp. AC466]
MSPTLALTFASAAGFLFGVAGPALIDQVTPGTPPAAASAVADVATDVVPDTAVLPGPDSLWEITTQTTVAGQAPTTTTASLCASAEDLKAPPVAITGSQCESQMFNPAGNTVSWTTDCEAVKGTGSLTLAGDHQSFSGDVVASSGGRDTTSHVTGKVTGTCTKS